MDIRDEFEKIHNFDLETEPKPDVCVNTLIQFSEAWKKPEIYVSWRGDTPEGYKYHENRKDLAKVKFTIDGETGKLKSVELIE